MGAPTSDATAILEATKTVQLSWARRFASQQKHRTNMVNLGNSNGRLFTARKVKLGEGAADDPEVLVTSTLKNSRYYLGHAGGDYIFRYKETHNTTAGDDPLAVGAVDAVSPIYEDPSHDAILCNPDMDILPANFTYCGQVPRSAKEYTSRFKTVYKDVVRIVESIVFFDPEVNMLEMCEASWQLSGPSTSKHGLVSLVRHWINRFAGDEKYLNWIQSKARNNPRILEFCYLTARLGSNNNGFVQEMSLLIQVLQAATGMDLFSMVEAYDMLTAQKATRELLLARDLSNFMVFDDDTIQDVHAFYDHPHFHSDPLNPCQRFNRLDVSAALEESERLWNEDQPADLHLGQDNSEVASESSASEPITPVQPELNLAPNIVSAEKELQKVEDEAEEGAEEREGYSFKSRRLHESEDEWLPDQSPTRRPKRAREPSSLRRERPAKRRKRSSRRA